MQPAHVTARDDGPSLPPKAGADRAAAPGSPAWLEAQWQLNRRWVAAIVLAYMPKWGDVDDVLQDVALAVVRRGGEVRDPDAFRPWLRTVAINAARLVARKGLARGEGSGAGPRRVPLSEADAVHGGASGVLARIGSQGAESVERVDEDDQSQALVRRAQALPDGYGEPLLLKAVHGLSYREIATILGLPETTIETRIARARRMLRDEQR